MINLIIIIIFILLCSVILYFKSKKKKKKNPNEFFVHDRIRFIEDYFEHDRTVKLITNRYKGKIVGFFIVVRKESMVHTKMKIMNYPTTSYELSIDEFCHFIEEYIKPTTDQPHMIRGLMRKHGVLLEWE